MQDQSWELVDEEDDMRQLSADRRLVLAAMERRLIDRGELADLSDMGIATIGMGFVGQASSSGSSSSSSTSRQIPTEISEDAIRSGMDTSSLSAAASATAAAFQGMHPDRQRAVAAISSGVQGARPSTSAAYAGRGMDDKMWRAEVCSAASRWVWWSVCLYVVLCLWARVHSLPTCFCFFFSCEPVLGPQASRGMEEGESGFAVEVPVPDQPYHMNDKFRPRKPRFFNRVKTGYDWNKYNQMHYDHDNPPPKHVQGYKFNIFYPDLLDPRYYHTPQECFWAK